MHRIVITGMGTVNALGNDVDEYSRNLFRGHNGAKPISRFDSSGFQTRVAAEIQGFDPSRYFDCRRELPYMDPFTQYGVVSARQALQQSGLELDSRTASRIAVVQGTGVGGQETQDQNFHRLYADGATRLHPATVARLIPSAAASHISISLGLTGPAICTASACAASAHAITLGALLIQSGQCDAAVVGGSEAPINFGCVKAWEGMRVLCRDACSPFSLGRSGVLLGEGGASLLLERETFAQDRGATPLAILSGYGMSSDAGSFVAPDARGPVACMQQALAQAGLQAQEIQHVNAHGSGTAQNDVTETDALHTVFQEHADQLAICSSKSMHGHTLGAASAIEAVATILAIQQQCVPPTINFSAPDPLCDLDYVPNETRSVAITHAMSNSFAFGGLNTSLVFSRPDN